MALKDTLLTDVKEIFKTNWNTREGRVVPEAEDIKLGNDAVKLTGVVLYADLAESTYMVKTFPAYFAAEVYKSYLHCASKIIRNNDGIITSFDGDRVMAVYIGDYKATNALRTALAVNHAVIDIINPSMQEQYKSSKIKEEVKKYTVKQAVEIDISEIFVARTGIRGSNDLVWVGNAANQAAKLCGLRTYNYASWATKAVYDLANDKVKTSTDKRAMWEKATWDGKEVYRSSWKWEQ
ncbi:adenylate/guanylate cyclase domain-containing protein [Adhaeribacter arboris]|uniref:Adenylate/guanylate cyclase domain-containing protein n=1 Tax=Adhaeribacter arboris TaxID=2072846 RepID=A0A2T2YIT2_9BACT|nr:adenylate/guanylate cyclase domain-containing protein [Adhaeribacter arboris]PSR55412.1 adenylate/guanylate cyclase domain-containing protein [Adhaeribacter arboris]